MSMLIPSVVRPRVLPASVLVKIPVASERLMCFCLARSAAMPRSFSADFVFPVDVTSEERAPATSVLLKPSCAIELYVASIDGLTDRQLWPLFLTAICNRLWATSKSSAILIASPPMATRPAPPANNVAPPMSEIAWRSPLPLLLASSIFKPIEVNTPPKGMPRPLTVFPRLLKPFPSRLVFWSTAAPSLPDSPSRRPNWVVASSTPVLTPAESKI